MASKRSLAIYWASSCGGCEVAVLNVHERLLDIDAAFQLVFCPCLVDTKIRDVDAMADAAIDVTLFNGAIRTQDNVEMAHLLRRKSRVLVAFGSCATSGGIPALSNFSSAQEHLDTIYRQALSTENPNGVLPQLRTPVPEGEVRLPRLLERATTLAETVGVDYFMPGCPPESHQVWSVLDLLIKDAPLPPVGSVLGAGCASVCAECLRTRQDKKIDRLYRTHEIVPDATACLLDQGIVCMGVATRDGCGALCPQVNMPCIGCYGPPEGVCDQGAKMASALGSMLDIEPLKRRGHDEIVPAVDRALDAIPDYTGTFYRFSLGSSLVRGAVPSKTPEVK